MNDDNNGYSSRYEYNMNFIFYTMEDAFIKYLLEDDTTNPSFYEYKRVRLTNI